MLDSQDETTLSNPQAADHHHPGALFTAGHILGGKYKVLSLLGRGGMGIVYKVEQIFLSKQLALKILDSRQVSNEAQMRRFRLEAKACNSLNHENLVKVHDFGLLDNEQPYLVMDLINGINLADYIKAHGALPVDKAVAIFTQACRGLSYAHQNSVIHRDIKPSNIMLVQDSASGSQINIKIVDFGIAKIASDEKGEIQALTRTGEVFGSPLYMSPEQCSGELIDLRTDIYSLGCTFFEALAGTPPHVGTNALRTMMLHQSAQAPMLSEGSMGQKFPDDLEHIVQRMLCKSPHERYQNLDEVAEDLASFSSQGTLSATGKLRKIAEKPQKGAKSQAPLIILLLIVVGVLSGVSSIFVYNRYFLSSTGAESGGSKQSPGASTVQKPNEVDSLAKGLDDVAVKTEKKESHSHLSFSAIKPITSVVVIEKDKRVRRFVFPDTSIGSIKVGYYFHDNPMLVQEAHGVRYVPVDEPLQLEVGGIHPESFNIPSIFKKIGPSEFSSLTIDAPDTRLMEEATALGRERLEGQNLAEILKTAESLRWSRFFGPIS